MTAKRLRELLARPELLVAPGAYDAIGARQIEQAGFDAVYMTGGVTAMALGFPDFGLVDLGEMAGNAARMTRATGLPVIADADTGYGNELNVIRTVREYEQRGVRASTSRTRSRPSVAATSRARKWCPGTSSSPRSVRRWRRGATRIRW